MYLNLTISGGLHFSLSYGLMILFVNPYFNMIIHVRALQHENKIALSKKEPMLR